MSPRTKPRPMTFTIDLPMTFTIESRPMTFTPIAVTLRTARHIKRRPMKFKIETVKQPVSRSASKKAKRYAP